MNIETLLLIHDRAAHKADADPTTTPIHLSATFHQSSATEFGTYDYSRGANPTRDALEARLALLECAAPTSATQTSATQTSASPTNQTTHSQVKAFAYPSGVAAINAIAALLAPGDQAIISSDIYGGTYRLLSDVWSKRGIIIHYADLRDIAAVRRLATSRTKLVHAEPLGNPLQSICDVAALAHAAHAIGALLSIDNTSLTPLNLRPLDLGADIVIHSATKYLNGHSDVTAGTLAVRDEALAKTLKFHHNAEGTALPPFESYLLLRGLQTMPIRLERQQKNAQHIAEFLATLPGITRVRYPGLPNQEGAAIHARQSIGHGAIVCFETGNVERSRIIVEALALFSIRVSFGSITSAASLPYFMSHKSIPAALRLEHAPPRDLIRLSIGLEDATDLCDDLARAVARAAASG